MKESPLRQICLPFPDQIRQCKVVASVSGGLGSIESLERALQKYGKDEVSAVFADVGTVVENGRVVCGEDEDLIRFLGETEAYLGITVHRIRHKMYGNIWDAFFGEKFMGNTQIDTCSKFLKRDIINDWIDAYHPGAIRVIGFSWLEKSRTEGFLEYYPNAWFPLCEKPYFTNEDIAAKWEDRGIKRSRSYDEGFSHDNCGGMCVKMGLGQAYDLWKLRPWRYEYAERREQEFQSKINSEVTIFRKSKNPISMKHLRILFENGYRPKTSNQEGCGGKCMVPIEGENK